MASIVEVKLTNHINGVNVTPSEDKYVDNVNPVNGSVISLIPDSGVEDVNQAVRAAKGALQHPEWNHNYVTARKRSDWLRKIADAIESRLEEFAAAESLDTGKPITLARTMDIPRSVENFRYFADFGRHLPADCHSSGL
jgi:acyl-CoA reductase-like NAD-dependent aldehyde dehydrogenase